MVRGKDLELRLLAHVGYETSICMIENDVIAFGTFSQEAHR